MRLSTHDVAKQSAQSPLLGALQRGRWRGECGCGLLRGPGAAHGARVQAGARDGGVGGCLGGTQIGVFRRPSSAAPRDPSWGAFW